VSPALQCIEKDLCIVSRDLTNEIGDLERHQVHRLLKDLDVKSITPSDLINDHILPCYKQGTWKVSIYRIF